MPRTDRAAPILLASVALVLGACSGDGGLDPEEQAELLEEAIITEDDLPDGFEESDPEDDEDDFEDCLEEVDVDPDALDDATVADEGPVAFEAQTDATLVGVEAELRAIDDTDVAAEVLEVMTSDDFVDCLRESAEEDAEDEGEEIAGLDLEVIDAAVDGDASGALRFSGDVQGFEFTAELHAVLVGDHLIRVETISLEDGLDDDLTEDVLETMIERLEEGS